MILQRIAASLKKRDWGTVVLEVLIVVVGIFLGLQVDDWNQARKAKILADQTEAQLIIDAHIAYQNAEADIARIEERVANGLLVLSILDGAALTDINKDRFEQGVAAIANSTAPEIGVGLLGVVLAEEVVTVNPASEAALREFETTIQRRLAVLDHIQEFINMRAIVIGRYFADGLNNGPYSVDRYDLEVMRNSPEFIYAYQWSVTLQEDRTPSVRTMMAALEKLLAVLEPGEDS